MSALIEAARAALSELEAVLCDPEGRAGIRGSDADNAIIDGALTSLRAALAAAEAQPVGEPAPHAMQQLTAALQADPDYAWSWHCNLAMPVMDVTGVTHRVANEAGARLMRHLFDIDITKHPHYQVDTAPPAQPAAQPLTYEQISALVLETVYENDERIPYRDYWVREIGMPFARAIEAAHGIGSQP